MLRPNVAVSRARDGKWTGLSYGSELPVSAARHRSRSEDCRKFEILSDLNIVENLTRPEADAIREKIGVAGARIVIHLYHFEEEENSLKRLFLPYVTCDYKGTSYFYKYKAKFKEEMTVKKARSQLKAERPVVVAELQQRLLIAEIRGETESGTR
jgi:hypothetical protein